MKKLIPLTFLLGLSLTLIAQPPRGPWFRQGPPIGPRPPMGEKMNEEKREKIELYKIQYITEKLNLNSNEAQVFWPIYNEHQKTVKAIFDAKMQDEILFEEAMLNAKKKYKADLKGIFKSEERINEALKAEKDFFRTMRKEVMKRRGLSA